VAARGPIDPDFRLWLERLAALHRRYPGPLVATLPPVGNLLPYGPYEIGIALLTIGWSERQLATHLSEHRTTLIRRRQRRDMLSPRESRWLDVLTEGHRAIGRPACRPGHERINLRHEYA